MAEVKTRTEVSITIGVHIKLTLSEAKALRAMVQYGHKAFLDGYYKQLGRSYMKPHESGVQSLFETINKELPGKIEKVESAINSVLGNKGIDKIYI